MSEVPPGSADAEAWEWFLNTPIRLWVCPVDHHRERPSVATVEWRDGIAHCTAPGCTRSSA